MKTNIRGNEIQHLVVELQKNEVIFGVMQSVLKMDDEIFFEVPYNLLFKKMIHDNNLLLKFSSRVVKSCKMIFSTEGNRKICDMSHNKSGIFFPRAALLCTNKHVEISNISDYYYAEGSGCLFLQSSSRIIKKNLRADDTYDLNCPDLLAYTCSSDLKSNLSGPGTIWLKIE